MAKAKTGIVTAVREGYSFEGACVELGALIVDGEPRADAKVRVPLAMLNRHGLVAGATGTGKTKTLQLMAEQLSLAGVPVFAADIKGDLSGLASPGEPGEKITARAEGIGQQWQPTAYPVELLRLGDTGTGVPVRATVTSFGPTPLSKVLQLNDTQESSLGLVFHYADRATAAGPQGPACRHPAPHLGPGQGRSRRARRAGQAHRGRDPSVPDQLRRVRR